MLKYRICTDTLHMMCMYYTWYIHAVLAVQCNGPLLCWNYFKQFEIRLFQRTTVYHISFRHKMLAVKWPHTSAWLLTTSSHWAQSVLCLHPVTASLSGMTADSQSAHSSLVNAAGSTRLAVGLPRHDSAACIGAKRYSVSSNQAWLCIHDINAVTAGVAHEIDVAVIWLYPLPLELVSGILSHQCHEVVQKSQCVHRENSILSFNQLVSQNFILDTVRQFNPCNGPGIIVISIQFHRVLC